MRYQIQSYLLIVCTFKHIIKRGLDFFRALTISSMCVCGGEREGIVNASHKVAIDSSPESPA